MKDCDCNHATRAAVRAALAPALAELHSKIEARERVREHFAAATAALERGQQVAETATANARHHAEADRAAQAAQARALAEALSRGAEPPSAVHDDRTVPARFAAERAAQIATQALGELAAQHSAAHAALEGAERAVARAADCVIDARARALIGAAENHLAALDQLGGQLRQLVPDSARQLIAPPDCLPEVTRMLERLPRTADDVHIPVDVLNGTRPGLSPLEEWRAALIAGDYADFEERLAGTGGTEGQAQAA